VQRLELREYFALPRPSAATRVALSESICSMRKTLRCTGMISRRIPRVARRCGTLNARLYRREMSKREYAINYVVDGLTQHKL